MLPFRPTSTAPLGTSLRNWGRSRDGGVAVTVAVMTAVLVGVLALSIDMARLYNASTERNNAADAAAVAAATQLGSGVGACRRAIDAAIAADLANQETFASNRTGPDVYLSPVGSTADGGNPTANPNIRFLSDLVKDNDGNVIGTYIADSTTCDDTASYVEVTADLVAPGQDAQVDYYFAGLVGALTSAFPRGYAVAEYPTASCALTPMFVCNLSSTWYEEVENYVHTGKGLWLKAADPSDTWGPGLAGFLRIGDIQATPELTEAIGMVNPPFACLGDDDTFGLMPGNHTAALKGFNSRLDMYYDGESEKSLAQWQPSPNSIKGLVKKNTGSACSITGQGYGYPDPRYDGPTTPPYAGPAMPLPRDECAYASGGGGCIPGSGADPLRMGDGVWEMDTYMAVNHPGLAPAQWPQVGDGTWNHDWNGSGNDQFNDTTISRYEMYMWEMDRPYTSGLGFADMGATPRLVDNTGAPNGPDPMPQPGEYGGQQCFTGTMGDSADATLTRDRRVIEVLVLDCPAGMNPSTTLTADDVAGTMELFIVEPWKVQGSGDHEIYTEIIGPGDSVDDAFQVQTVKQWINLKESRQDRP